MITERFLLAYDCAPGWKKMIGTFQGGVWWRRGSEVSLPWVGYEKKMHHEVGERDGASIVIAVVEGHELYLSNT